MQKTGTIYLALILLSILGFHPIKKKNFFTVLLAITNLSITTFVFILTVMAWVYETITLNSLARIMEGIIIFIQVRKYLLFEPNYHTLQTEVFFLNIRLAVDG